MVTFVMIILIYPVNVYSSGKGYPIENSLKQDLRLEFTNNVLHMQRLSGNALVVR